EPPGEEADLNEPKIIPPAGGLPATRSAQVSMRFPEAPQHVPGAAAAQHDSAAELLRPVPSDSAPGMARLVRALDSVFPDQASCRLPPKPENANYATAKYRNSDTAANTEEEDIHNKLIEVASSKEDKRPVLLCLDQFEELFVTVKDTDRTRFFR